MIVVVSVASFVLLLGGIGALVWYHAATHERDESGKFEFPTSDPLFGVALTPSMKATLKYFWIVGAMLVVQMIMGIVVAHYGVEGNGFYGLPLADWIPYSLARTWHSQLGASSAPLGLLAQAARLAERRQLCRVGRGA